MENIIFTMMDEYPDLECEEERELLHMYRDRNSIERVST